jgi:site-specific recombinase XerD
MTPERNSMNGTPIASGRLRDRALLEIRYYTGMRKGEHAALNLANFSFERQEMVIETSKS